MKTFFTISAVLACMTLHAQMNILFVNDNGYITSNTEAMIISMTLSGYNYNYFSARDSMRSPTAAEMDPYHIVIWYSSNDGVGNYFWNGGDTDNPEIMEYLDQGGKLWVIGADLMYDRYGSAPDTFSGSDFPYHYMGISEYKVQSYGDDGSLGVPQLDLASFLLPFPDSILWMFTTAWWVDGCTLTDAAKGVYKMGPASYTFSDYYSGILIDTDTSFQVLSFLFDPAIMNTDDARNGLVKMVLGWYEHILNVNPVKTKALTVYPNPANQYITVELNSISNLSIFSIDGRTVYKTIAVNDGRLKIDISDLPAGLYYMVVNSDKLRQSAKFIVK